MEGPVGHSPAVGVVKFRKEVTQECDRPHAGDEAFRLILDKRSHAIVIDITDGPVGEGVQNLRPARS
jgi:hypothetical protein